MTRSLSTPSNTFGFSLMFFCINTDTHLSLFFQSLPLSFIFYFFPPLHLKSFLSFFNSSYPVSFPPLIQSSLPTGTLFNSNHASAALPSHREHTVLCKQNMRLGPGQDMISISNTFIYTAADHCCSFLSREMTGSTNSKQMTAFSRVILNNSSVDPLCCRGSESRHRFLPLTTSILFIRV